MKNFIYYENGWRWFEAEQLPIIVKISDCEHYGNYSRSVDKYNFQISFLKAKSLPVGNPEILQELNFILEDKDNPEYKIDYHQWNGTVKVKKTVHCDEYHQHTKKSCFIQVAILKIPNHYNRSFVKPLKSECKHENETLRQGDGFVYVVCSDCGKSL